MLAIVHNFKMSMLILFVCTLSFVIHAYALECGLTKHLEDENVKNSFQKCIANWTVVVVEKSTEEPINSTTESTPSSTTELNKNLTTTGNSTEKKLSKRSLNSTPQEVQKIEQRNDESGTTDSSKCVVYCILQTLELLDSQGYPDHHRIANALSKNSDEREVKDFFQDATDECFQLPNQDKADICQYTNTLVSCLAEKGRLNCGDWNFYSISFA